MLTAVKAETIQSRDYRQMIRDAFAQRCSVNPRYSLRAFARDLDISPAQLSQVLSNKRGISIEKARAVFHLLGIHGKELDIYVLQVAGEHGRSSKERSAAMQGLRKHLEDSDLFQLTRDAFDIMAEWYHLAILQAFALKDCPSVKSVPAMVQWLTQKLSISEVESKSGIERLLRLGLLEEVKGRLKVSHHTVISSNGVPSEALRKFHRQLIGKALAAIELQTLDERYLNSIVLPVRQDQISEIQKRIFNFQKKLMKIYGRGVQGDADVVYGLSQQFFRISEKAEKA